MSVTAKSGTVTIEITGLDTLAEAWRRIADEAAAAHLDDVTGDVLTEAVALWPVRTGASRAALDRSPVQRTAHGAAVTFRDAIGYGTEVPYGDRTAWGALVVEPLADLDAGGFADAVTEALRGRGGAR